jgi:long-chain acyl-CoA synthetase
MLNLYEDIAHADPDRLAIIDQGAEYSYRDFLRRIDVYASWIQRSGPPHARVGIVGLSRFDYLAAVYACAKVGAVAVPGSSNDKQRTQAILQAAGVALTIDSPPSDEPANIERASTQEAMILFTSGTTSEGRKGVILGHEGISTTARFMNRAMGVDRTIRELVYAPLDHAFAFGRCHAVLMAQGTLILVNLTGFVALFDAIRKYKANALSAAPSVLASILRASSKTLAEAGAELRWIQTGAMRFDPTFRDRLCDAFPGARIYLHYGLSEAMRVTFLELQGAPHKRHTEGGPADGVEIAILGPDGEQLARGEQGIIAVRGRNVCLGYTDPALWKKSCRDGWFVTSDRGLIDEDGFLVFSGRDDDAINANGFLVHPDEIESRLQRLFATQAFTVLGLPDPNCIKDKIIVVCVEGATAITLTDVAAAMSGSEAHMIPQTLTWVETLPLTVTGKVNRAELAKRLAQRAADWPAPR